MFRTFQKALVAIVAFAMLPGLLRAQSAPQSYGDNQTLAVGGEISGYHIGYGENWLGGVGAFVDADLNWHYGIEGEARWSRYHQHADVHDATYLVGPRVSLNAEGKFRPYVKFLVGEGTFNFSYNYANGHYFLMAPGGGLDYRINRRIRLRLIDFEYQYWPQFTFGAMSSYGLSAGIRYRLF